MDCTIDVKVRGSHLTKDNRNAGVQHEANVKKLRIDFDDGWDNYGKTVTFWNALMDNPVKIVLTTDRLEDIELNTRVYIVPIPGEAMNEAGDLTFVIDGYIDGKRKRSVSDTLWVREAPFEPDAAEPADPTPTQAEQLQKEIDGILGTIQQSIGAAADAQQAASWAESSSQEAYQYAQDANASFNSTVVNVELAQEAQAAAEAARDKAVAITGGDYPSTQEAKGFVSEHNKDTTAHNDIRDELLTVARAKTGGEIDNRLQNRVEKTGDTMTGILTFDTPGLFSAFQKKRTISDKNYIMKAGIGNYGTGATLSLRLSEVAADNTETVISQFDIDKDGLVWLAPGGIRKTIAHSGNIGVLTASVE